MFSITHSNIFVFLLTVPGVTFGIGGLDSFPFALFYAIFILSFYKILIDRISVMLIFLLLIIFTCAALSDVDRFNTLGILRQFLNYVSILVCAITIRKLDLKIETILRVLAFSLGLNILLGSAQLLGVDLFFSNARTDELRGAVGLFPEPTSLGLFSFATFIIGYCAFYNKQYTDFKKSAKRVIIMSLFCLIIISQSSTGILLLSIFMVLKVLKFNFKTIIFFTLIFTFAWALFPQWSHTRAGAIVKVLLADDLWVLLAKDGSINERLSAVVGPYYGLITNYGIPSSAFSYKQVVIALQEYSNGFFWYGGSNKIMNFLGTIIYETSFLGFIIISRYILPNFLRSVSLEVAIIWILFLSMSVSLSHGYILLLPIAYRLCRPLNSSVYKVSKEFPNKDFIKHVTS